VGHGSRFGGLFHLKASRVRIFQSDLKTGGGTTTGGAHGKRRLRRDQVENVHVDVIYCVRSCYSYFIIFYVLDHRGIVVF
jgi:hypothetical protein